MFVALSRFVVRNGMEEDVHQAFLDRPHLVDDAPGFLRMEVLRPDSDPREFWLLTWWEEESHYKSWHKGHTYKASHKGMPKGLKLVPGAQEIRTFRSICD